MIVRLEKFVEVVDKDKLISYANERAFQWGFSEEEGEPYFDDSNIAQAVEECVILNGPDGLDACGLDFVDGPEYHAYLKDLVLRLLAWHDYMGGFESEVWREAEGQTIRAHS